MKHDKSFLPTLLVGIGSALFIFVLWLSAYFETDIRWLHFFQAWMYIPALVLVWRGNRWGYFIGFSAAIFWDYGTLFVNAFLLSGLHWLGQWLQSGRLEHVDQIVSVPAWIGNLLVIVGCFCGYAKVAEKSWPDVARFLAAFVFTTAFFAAIIALCQPRYLPLFQGSLHPHWPMMKH